METRFSVWWRPGPPAFEESWLRERIELLRRFCLPSVAAQTSQSFTWLLFCDAATDVWAIEALRAARDEAPMLTIAFTGAHRRPADVVGSAIDPAADVLITTHLDSDDALADGYVEAVQEYASSFHASRNRDLLVNFPNGYRLDASTDQLYRRRMPASPFHSLLERPASGRPRTVFHPATETQGQASFGGAFSEEDMSHNLLHELHPTHQDESFPAWLQVLHGENLSNRISPLDRRLPPQERPAGFPLDPQSSSDGSTRGR